MKKQVSKFEKNFDKFMVVYYVIFGVILGTTVINIAMNCYLFEINEVVVGIGNVTLMFLPVLVYGIGYKLANKRDIQTGNIAG